MIRGVPHEAMVETLLDSLAVERHAQRALAYELFLELSASRYASAKDEVRLLLRRLESATLSQTEIAAAVAGLRSSIAALVSA